MADRIKLHCAGEVNVQRLEMQPPACMMKPKCCEPAAMLLSTVAVEQLSSVLPSRPGSTLAAWWQSA